MTDPATLDPAPGSPEDAVWEAARLIAVIPPVPAFLDVADAFASWMAFHRLLYRVGGFAGRCVGTQHEMVHMLKPWTVPLCADPAPRNAAAAAFVRATQLLERVPIPPAADVRSVDEPGEPGRLLLTLTRLVLLLAGVGEALARRLGNDGACAGSPALQLEASRLRRHLPRLALAAVDTLEELRGAPHRAGHGGTEPARQPEATGGRQA